MGINMRKNFNKIISIVLILLMLVPSMVMAETNIAIDYIQEHSYVTVSVNGTRNRPASITIKDETKYYYVDQGFTDDLGKIVFKTTLDLGKTYDCQVKIDDDAKTIQIVMKDEPNPEPKDNKVDIYIKGYKGVILDAKNVVISENETVLSLTTRMLDDRGIQYENRNGYIASIDNQSEKDRGERSGWMFSVNGKYPNVGAGSVILKNNDDIKWLYTEDLGGDIGAPMYPSNPTASNLNKIIEETLKVINNVNSTEKEIIEVIKKLLVSFNDEISNSNSDSIKELNEIISENIGILLSCASNLNDKQEADKLVDQMLDISIKAEDKLSKAKEDVNRTAKKSIKIASTEKSKDISEIILSKLLLEKAIEKVEIIKISSDQALLEIAPNFIGNSVKEDVKIELESNNKSVIIKLSQGERVINTLENPIKIVMPYEIGSKDKNNVVVSLVEEDGTNTLIGGAYISSTKSMNFLTHKLGEFKVEENIAEFKDLSDHAWAEEAVNAMASKGIIGGKAAATFAPADNITRAEFSALISRMLKYNENLESSLIFKDVNKNEWYYKSISSTYRNGLINGKSELSFDPNGYITREEMSKIIGEILVKNHYKKQDSATLIKFIDGNEIAQWAEEGAAIAVHNEILKGANSKFNPKSNATRAEVAVMLYRLYELIMK